MITRSSTGYVAILSSIIVAGIAISPLLTPASAREQREEARDGASVEQFREFRFHLVFSFWIVCLEFS